MLICITVYPSDLWFVYFYPHNILFTFYVTFVTLRC
nr:MAG TPA: hypothetical protein [Caudoviricetes sp.]